MHKHIKGTAAAAVLGTAVLLAPVGASAAGTVTITPSSELLNTTETRATGHVDFEEHSLHVWTEGATSTDKAAAYFDLNLPLAEVGEPEMDWRFTDPALPAIPGKQIVFDTNGILGDGIGDWNILVGEPVYGDVWWLTGGADVSGRRRQVRSPPPARA